MYQWSKTNREWKDKLPKFHQLRWKVMCQKPKIPNTYLSEKISVYVVEWTDRETLNLNLDKRFDAKHKNLNKRLNTICKHCWYTCTRYILVLLCALSFPKVLRLHSPPIWTRIREDRSSRKLTQEPLTPLPKSFVL